ncbi:MAG: hypothetical protein NTX32_06625 [Candidatus Firestonebacteria bacterium]|nr:hypothetical protein [Candidatus Firestonebacteria bacterium]
MNVRNLFCGTLGVLMASILPLAAKDAAPTLPTSASWEREASESAMLEYNSAMRMQAKNMEAFYAAMAKAPEAKLPEALASAAKDKGFVLFQRALHKNVGRKTAPSTEEAAVNDVKVTAAADEFRGVQLGLWTVKNLSKVSCVMKDLSGAAGKIDAKNIRVYHLLNLVTPVFTKGAAEDGDISQSDDKSKAAAFKENAVALMDLPSVDIPANEARGIWMDFLVPKSAAAGIYKGELQILVDGKESAKVPVELTVLPFVLDQANEWGRGSFTSKHQDEKQLIQTKENGHTMVSWWTFSGCTVKYSDGVITGDFSGYQDYLKLVDKVGYTGKHMNFISGSDPKIQNRILKFLGRDTIENARKMSSAKAFKNSDLSEPFGKLLCDLLKQYHAQMKEVGHGDLPVCLLDEPDHEPRPTRMKWYNQMYALVEKGAPEIPTYGTFYHEGDEKKMSHHHSIWMTNCPSVEKYTACKAAGKELWTYHFGFQFCDDTTPTRFRLGILPWVYGATGTFYWANFWDKSSPFDSFGATTADALDTATLMTAKGPLSSKMNKAIRESVDDRRYITTLEKLIVKAKGLGGEFAKQAAADEAFLESIQKPLFEKMVVRGGRPSFSKIGKIEIAGTKGRKGVLESAAEPKGKKDKSLDPLEAGATSTFAEFVRAEVTDRILAYQEKVK